MKYVLSFVVTLLCSLQFCIAQDNGATAEEDTKVSLTQATKNNRDRSTGFASVDAFIHREVGLITVVGCELGDADIYILDEIGNMCCTGSSYFVGIESEFSMEIPQWPGRYWLIIDSKVLYAEGTFLINN